MFSLSILFDSAPPRPLQLPRRLSGPVRLGEVLDRILELRPGTTLLPANQPEDTSPPELPRAA